MLEAFDRKLNILRDITHQLNVSHLTFTPGIVRVCWRDELCIELFVSFVLWLAWQRAFPYPTGFPILYSSL